MFRNLTRRKKLFIIYGTCIVASGPFFSLALQPKYPKKHKDDNRTIIVTGATGNLGSALTYELANRNLRVVMACRDLEKCRMLRREIVIATGNHKLLCRHLDLEDVDSIDSFVRDVTTNEPHIDVLINSAAVRDIPQRELTKYGIEKNYFVNFLAPFLLTSKLMPKLKESASITKDSRIVNVIGNPKKSWNVDLDDINFDQRPYNSREAHNQSKLALAYFTILLDKLNRKEKNCVYVYGSSPGRKNVTKMFHYDFLFMDYVKNGLKAYLSGSATRVVQSAVKCALDPQLTQPGASGKLYVYWDTWFWGVANKEENKSKKVWNMAIEQLAHLQVPTSVINNKDAPS